MQFFIDSADIKEIEAAAKTGLIDGVTTNPSLVAKTKTSGGPTSFEDLITQICKIVDGPVSAEVTALDTEGMVKEGRELAKLHSNVVVKIPLTWEGLAAVRLLSDKNIKTNVTLCFSTTQALMAAKAGATYISPFVGRLDDIGQAGMDLISDIRLVYTNYGFKTKILAASLRHVEHVLQSARMGADVGTVPYKVFHSLIQHPLTDKGLAQFLKDWDSFKK